MRSSHFIGGCIVISSIIFSAKDIYSLIQNTNVVGTTDGFVRLGQVNAESTLVRFAVISGGDNIFEVEGSTEEIVGLVKDRIKEIVEDKNKTVNDDSKKLNVETVAYMNEIQLQLSSKIIYNSEYKPVFNLNLHKFNKDFPKNTLIMSLIPELQAYNANVIAKSKSLSFM
ncbi:hypothetical protein ACFWHB_11850 [Aeromonas mytilicola subsp. aquatica]|uniref:hypothetical protein n=1 Tax=Aeromonas mytilicola TaxID=3377113 RepID=UPI0037C19F9C